MFLFGILSYLSLPTGGLWLLLWPFAVALVWRPLPKTLLIWNGALLVTCALLGQVVPVLVEALNLPYPGAEFDARNIINRLRYISFFDVNRIAFLLVPVGMVPAMSLIFWRRQDRIARMLTLVTLTFFLFFYFQGYRVLMHHFIPAMIPPLIILWRYDLMQQARIWLATRSVVAAGLVVALWLAWPAVTGLHTFSRQIGQQVQVSGDRFDGFSAKALDTFHTLFGDLFPIQYTDGKAEENYFGGPLVWYFYALQAKPESTKIIYDLRPLSDGIPGNARLFKAYDGYGLHITDEVTFAAHQSTGFTTHFGAPIFQTSRNEIFGRGATNGTRLVIDLVAIARNILGIENTN